MHINMFGIISSKIGFGSKSIKFYGRRKQCRSNALTTNSQMSLETVKYLNDMRMTLYTVLECLKRAVCERSTSSKRKTAFTRD